MSVVEKESIEVIAQSIGVTNLSPDVLPSLAADIEYRVREIMQEAIKCMHHAKRTAMISDDVDSALELRKMEQPIYVAASGNSLRFKRATRSRDLFYVEDKDLEFREVIEAPLPKAPLDTTVVNHWLAIEGVQPAIPENAPLEVLVAPYDNRKPDCKEDDIKTPVKHVLSIELQLYFEKITDLTVSRSNSVIFNKALLSLATDAGLHPLVPYFIYFVAEEVTRNLNNFQLLFALMRLVRSLLQNPYLHIEPYLHQLMPSVMTCLVAKSLGNKLTDNHWELRNFTANLVALIFRRFGYGYHNLQLRVTRTLLHSFLDPAKAFPQNYGAIKGMTAIGPQVVRMLLLPNLDPYLQYIEPEMQLEKQKNESRRHEAWRVHGALTCAAGLCIYHQLKMIPNLLSPPLHNSTWKRNGKLGIANPNKRKATGMMDQPLKKVATPEGSHLVKVEMQGGSSGFSITRGGSDTGLPRFLPNDNMPGGGRRDRFGQMSSVAVSRAWKKETNAGHLLPKLYDLFGESMFPFVPSPELCNFHL
ncbi:transcription initiation factor TFIID subunit 6 isoform X1 [Helianthus annuus]|uniref:transcription initiation factor TFIID subunit 6 isoform X1 n=1 Tax=Helianthus annuus TaxID=4232 RepID=UPI000B909D51|nr:transcription initiation factor TFIID subunit 6 isoform X1 [Helianthus annuus]